MDTLRVRDYYGQLFHWPRWELLRPGNLRTLELVRVGMSTQYLEHFLSWPALSGLAHLTLGKLRSDFSRLLYDYDLARLSNVLEIHLPGLVSFEWAGRTSENSFAPFSSFKNLLQLKQLTLDFNSMIPHGQLSDAHPLPIKSSDLLASGSRGAQHYQRPPRSD
jgi:hypothetical protein